MRAALGRLLLVIAAVTFTTIALGIGWGVVMIVAVLVMVMLHEFGHFVTAKWAGMKVTEFFVGFGPKLWSVNKRETEYGIKALPLGGYVKIIGMHNLEEVDPADEPRSYRQAPFWQRLAVGVAGSAMHFLIAFMLLWVLNAFIGIPRPDAPPTMEIAQISRLETGESPAQKAGLRPGDRIVAVDGRQFDEWDDLPIYIRAHPEETLVFQLERDARRLEVPVTPVDLSKIQAEGLDGKPITEPTGFVGISPAILVEKEGVLGAIPRSAGDLGFFTKETLGAFGKIFSADGLSRYGDQLTGRGSQQIDEDTPRFLSPVGVARIAGEVANSGIGGLLMLLVGINLFVGIFNMMPLLPLDGGHVAIAIYEGIRSRISRRRYYADVAKMLPLAYAVVLLFVFIGVTSLYLDIFRPLELN
jgi:membrane-associated protease RseP (regulator of RpoE activity)